MTTMDAYNSEMARFRKGFGKNVRLVRMAKRPLCSQEQLAAVTGLHRTAIGKIEQGVAEPRLSTLVILADGLGVGVEDLLGGLSVPYERRPSPNTGTWT
jgi:transcriptional regulator with XRE-family HTH domain